MSIQTVSLPINYATGAANFNGSSSEMGHTANSLTFANGEGAISFWFNLQGGNGALMVFFHSELVGNAHILVSRETSNKIRVKLYDGTDTFTFETAATYTSGNGWKHFMASWDGDFTAGNKLYDIYVNGVSDSALVADAGAAIGLQANMVYWIGSFNSVSNYYNGDLSEFYLDNAYTDLSVLANRRKFYSTTGRSVYLGPTGNKPTGSQSKFYFKGNGSGFTTNSGSQPITSSTAITSASTTPSQG